MDLPQLAVDATAVAAVTPVLDYVAIIAIMQCAAKIVVVLGHEDCGAVKAAMAGQPAADLVPSILNRIYPAIRGLDPKAVEKGIRANTSLAASTLAQYSAAIRKVPVVGAYYSVKTGRITKVG